MSQDATVLGVRASDGAGITGGTLHIARDDTA
jgi:hypothetical protein